MTSWKVYSKANPYQNHGTIQNFTTKKMTIDKYFFNRFKQDNPREHYNLVLDALDDLSRQFTSAIEMAEYLNNLTEIIKLEKVKSKQK